MKNLKKFSYLLNAAVMLLIFFFACFRPNHMSLWIKNSDGLVWSDEFNKEGAPDSTYWVFQTGGHGWGNREWQYYRAGTSNAEVKDGKLIITARMEEFEGKSYTSARIITKNKIRLRYGRVEASMRLPFGQGIWPAFWMLGENIDSVDWPRCGEIDIMEMIGGDGRENTVHGTAHWINAEGKEKFIGESITLSEGLFADDFHTFSISWNPQKIVWYMDGEAYHEQDISTTKMEAFHKPFYLLINLAVGGNWPGYPDETTVFPQYLKVDYVRVYSD